MAEPSQLIQHIETFVDVARSPSQQASSLEAIASALKKDVLSMEQLVRELELYLTTTDNVVRARGILLLAEVLKYLETKPLDNAVVRSLIGFFADRLADWRALRGALVGCLVMLRRKGATGVATATDAEAVAKSFLQNLQVQSLAQHDRKLCFELLECLLEWYPQAVKTMGNTLVYGTCEAIDGEKDPQCLMVAFHVMELLARLFPDPYGPIASNAADLFDALGCYFPLHFTHTKREEADIRREDLSGALMLAFSSTPLFEPFAIPLLLEKLSSSLPVAKVDSLKYLRECALKYGAGRMARHYGGLWSSLKDAFYSFSSMQLSFAPESLTGPGFQENEIQKESLNLLQRLVLQDISFLGFIVDDVDVKTIIGTISDYPCFEEMAQESKLKLLAISRILSVSAKASTASCNRIFEIFFLPLMNILGISKKTSTGDYVPEGDSTVSTRLKHGAVYLCIELLAASRDVILGSKECSSACHCGHEAWCSMVKSFLLLLIQVFTSAIANSSEDNRDADVYLGVKGLQTLGMFPGGFSLISKSVFEKILMTLTSIIMAESDKTQAWKLAAKALACMGSFFDQYNESEKAMSYMDMVVDKFVSLASSDHSNVPYPLILEATSEVCTTGPKYTLKTIQGFEEALCGKLSGIYVKGNSKAIKNSVQLLECFSNKLLPWVVEVDGLEEILLQFAISIWNQIETCTAFNCQIHVKELTKAAMMAMKLVVATLSLDNQNSIVQKAYNVVSSTKLPLTESIPSTSVALEGLQIDDKSIGDELVLSLFASVVIAVSPSAYIPNVKSVIHMFLLSLLRGHLPAAQALGSLVNKLGSGSCETKISGDSSLEEAIDIIFHTTFTSENSPADGVSEITSGSEINLTKLCYGVYSGVNLQTHAIMGLAWIGKGLLMRGNERVNDITLVFLECLKAIDSSGQSVHSSVMKHAADAFYILMHDSELCLDRKFHAIIRPLYKQRYFSTTVPILESLIMKSDTSHSRIMLYLAFTHVVSHVPLVVILDNAKKLIPMILEGLFVLSHDTMTKDAVLSLLLVLSGILTDKIGQEVIVDSAHIIIDCLVKLTTYPHIMLVRETAIQCLVSMEGLPYRRIYPLRAQVLQAIAKALDDPKRRVRQEAVRCRQIWASMASRSLRF